MAVRHERTHPQLLGKGEGLLIVGCGPRTIRRLTPYRKVTEEAQGIRLVAAFLVRTGERQRSLGQGVCLRQAASQGNQAGRSAS